MIQFTKLEGGQDRALIDTLCIRSGRRQRLIRYDSVDDNSLQYDWEHLIAGLNRLCMTNFFRIILWLF
jgi:hypothetical protein